jgi:hypothetical protein
MRRREQLGNLPTPHRLAEIFRNEGRTIVALQDQRRAVLLEEGLENGLRLLGRDGPDRLPGKLLMARQVTNREQIRIGAVDRLIRLTMIHGPYPARLVPGQTEAPGGVAAAPYPAVTRQQIAQHTARDLRKETAEGR